MHARALFIAVLIAFAAVGSIAPVRSAETGSVPLGKLPDTVIPKSYVLDLTIIPERDRFAGHAVVTVNIRKASDHIWMHGRDLNVTSATLVTSSGRKLSVHYAQVDPSGVARLDLPKRVKGTVQLDFHYTAPFNRSLEGIYKVTEGAKSYIFSQMEPSSARLAFPGFDEPRFKTPFDVTLTVPEADAAIVNTPLAKETKLEGGLKRLHFAPTKPLPTYLLAFIVGDLDVVTWNPIPATDIRDHPIPLRGVAARGKGADLRYILEHTAELVTGLERYFGRPYPFAKLDVIAAVDFSAGAMENAGAIVYREQSILIGEGAPLDQKRSVLVTHTHELSHQWFGDLVTPAWWDDIWLNESFATWMSYRTLNALYPDDHYDRDFERYVQRAFGADSLVTARQIRQPVKDLNDVATAFDRITYAKGGGVLSMMESYLGPDEFQAGIRAYLNKFAFGTATAGDLIRSIAKANHNKQVVPAFNSFLTQSGVPLLEVARDCGPDGAGRITLNQSRYLPLGSKGSPDRLWSLPACLSEERGGAWSRQCQIVAKRQDVLTYRRGACPSVVMPNASGAGYYRWTLDAASWNKLFAVFPDLPAREQLSVADSLAVSFDTGKISKQDYISRAAELAKSGEWDIASAPMGALGFIIRRVTPEDEQAALRQRVGAFYLPKLKAYGLDPTTAMDKTDPIDATRMRSAVVDFLANTAEDKMLRAELAERAKRFIGAVPDGERHRDALTPDLVSNALRVGVEDLGASFVDTLLTQLATSKDAILRNQILWAVGHVEHGPKLDEVRELALSDTLRNNEVSTILSAQMSDDKTRDGMWDWIRVHYAVLVSRFPKWRQNDLIGLASGFCSAERRAEVQKFFAPYVENIEGGGRTLAQTTEEISLCAALKHKYS